MKLTKHLALATVLTSVCGLAQAESGWYMGASSSFADFEEKGVADLELSTIQVQTGMRFNKHFAVEARLGTGLSDDSASQVEDGINLKIDLETDYIASAFVKGIIPAGPVELYGLLGYTHAELDAKVTAVGEGISISETFSDSDISYGVGLAFQPTAASSIFVEYMNFYDDDDIEISGYTLGFNFSF